ncbi:MAG: EAL domain-containing protein [Ferrimonas sp.]
MMIFQRIVWQLSLLVVGLGLLLIPCLGWLLMAPLATEQQLVLDKNMAQAQWHLRQQWQQDQSIELAAIALDPIIEHAWLQWPNGQTQSHQSLTKTKLTGTVPKWLQAYPPFAPLMRSEPLPLNDGAKALTLSLTVDNATYYYRWRQQLLSLVLILGLVQTGFLWVNFRYLRFQLWPLKKITERVQALSRLEFEPPLSLHSKDNELTLVGNALNALGHKLKREVDDAHRQLQRLQDALLIDPVSELPNRSYIVERIEDWLKTSDSGALAIVSLRFLDEVRLRSGFQVRDNAIGEFSSYLMELKQQYFGTQAARISATDFVLILEHGETQSILSLVQHASQRLYQQTKLSLTAPYGIGAVMKQRQSSAGIILAQADNALLRALHLDGHLCWHEIAENMPLCREQWQQVLEEVLQQQHVELLGQPVFDLAGDKIQYTVMAEVVMDGQLYLELNVQPHLDRLGMSIQFDKLKLILAQSLPNQFTPIAFRLSAQSIESYDFITWLSRQLQLRSWGFQFEVSEQMVLLAPRAVERLRELLRNYGYKFGVYHFGRHLVELNYLSWLQPDYVKLDSGFTHLPQSPMQFDMMQAMCATLQTLNISVYLTDVTDDKQLQQNLPLNGFSRIASPHRFSVTATEAAKRYHEELSMDGIRLNMA